MVKSERYTCNVCDKMFSSASSIWNHRSKIHKDNKMKDNQPYISQTSANISQTSANISHTSANHTSKLSYCVMCYSKRKYFFLNHR